jgi:hypothetical protein
VFTRLASSANFAAKYPLIPPNYAIRQPDWTRLDKDLEQGDHACSQVKSRLSPISAGSREIVSSQKRLKKIISEIFEQNSSIWGESRRYSFKQANIGVGVKKMQEKWVQLIPSDD